MKKNGKLVNCLNCGKEVYRKMSQLLRCKTHHCSRKCVDETQKTRFLGNKNPNNKYDLDGSFFKELNEDKAYILGWVASDGNIKDDTITISIKSSDELILKKIRDVVNPKLPIKCRYDKCMSVFRMCSKEMVKDVCNILGIPPGKKSHTVKFPSLGDDNMTWAFLRGLFDGDGCISDPNTSPYEKGYPSPRISLASCSENMLLGVKGFVSSQCSYFKGKGLEWNGVNALDLMGKLYDNDSDLYLARKKDLFRDWSVWVPSLIGRGNNFKVPAFKCVRTRKDAILPSKSRVSDSGYDIHLLELVKKVGDLEYYDTGLKFQPAYGYYLDLVPRSSFSKTGYVLANSIGIIDRSYTGNILVAVRKIDKNAPNLELPKRYMQIIPREVIHFEIEEVEEFEETDRNSGGFGSSGS